MVKLQNREDLLSLCLCHLFISFNLSTLRFFGNPFNILFVFVLLVPQKCLRIGADGRVCCSPAAAGAERVVSGQTRVTLQARHAGSTRAPSLHIALQTRRTCEGRQTDGAREEKDKWEGNVKGAETERGQRGNRSGEREKRRQNPERLLVKCTEMVSTALMMAVIEFLFRKNRDEAEELLCNLATALYLTYCSFS